jgi:hypothetical protein
LGHVYQYAAILSGANASPANSSPATGSGLLILDLDLHVMDVKASFSGLVGNVTAATLNGNTSAPLSGTAINVTAGSSLASFPANVNFGDFNESFDLAAASTYNPAYLTAHGPLPSSALEALYAGLEGGKSYLNITSSAYPNGEIRGFLIRLLGDFNHNLVVDAADYTVWRNTLHRIGEKLAADTDHNAFVDHADYLAWQQNYGRNVAHLFPGSGSQASIPEPATNALLAIGIVTLFARRRRHY